MFHGKAKLALEEALPAYLQTRRWYQGRFRTLKTATVRDSIVVPGEHGVARIALIQVEYLEGDPDAYLLPLAFASDSNPRDEGNAAAPVVVRLRIRSRGENEALNGVLYEPCGDRTFIAPLLDVATKGGRLEGDAGELRGEPSPVAMPEGAVDAPPRLVELNNTYAILEGRGVLLKLYRRVEEGRHPEVEVLRYFARTGLFPHTPQPLGVLEYQPETGEAMTAGLLREFAVSEGDAWNLTLDSLRRFFDQVLTGTFGAPDWEVGPRSVADLSEQETPPRVLELLGAYLETARRMARRTAEMHVALAAGVDDPAFAPEPFTPMYQRSLYQSMRGQIRRALEGLRRQLKRLPDALQEPARRILHGEEEFLRLAKRILDKVTAVRIRCHGDYHLKHLLSTGSDFLIVDFEGEPDRPLSHRRRKRSPIRDLTSLHRSLQEAAQTALLQGNLRAEDVPVLRPWALFWQRWASVVFLKEYRAAPGTAALLPQDTAEMQRVSEFYRLGWSIYRLARELDPPAENLAVTIQNVEQMLAPPE